MRAGMIIGRPRRANTRNRPRPRSHPMFNSRRRQRQWVSPDLVSTIRIEPGKPRRPTTTAARQRPIVLAAPGRISRKQPLIEALGLVLAILLVVSDRDFRYIIESALWVLLLHFFFALARLSPPPSRHFSTKSPKKILTDSTNTNPTIPEEESKTWFGCLQLIYIERKLPGRRKSGKKKKENKLKNEMKIWRRHV